MRPITIVSLCLFLAAGGTALAQGQGAAGQPAAAPTAATPQDAQPTPALPGGPNEASPPPAAAAPDEAARPGAASATWEGKTVAQWADALADEDVRVRWYAAYALGQLGPQAVAAVPALMTRLKLREDQPEQEYVRGGAAWALGRIGSDQAVPLLIETLASKHVSVRRNAPLALGRLGKASVGAVDKLLELLRDPDATVRVNSAVALWEIARHEQAIPALVQMIRKGTGPAPYLATVALGGLEADPSLLVPPLLDALQIDDLDAHRAASRALGKIGSPALPAIQGALRDPKPEVRRAAVEALGWLGPEAMSALVAALDDEAPEPRAAAARALGRLGPQAADAYKKLIVTINDRNTEVREAAAKAIQEITKR
jgi:HEAT repeat protein